MRPSSLPPTIVTASGLGKAYLERRVVEDVSFTLEPGTVSAFLGANGAGKSTTLHLLVGLIRGEGRTHFAGRSLVEHPEPCEVVGAYLGGEAFHPRRSARDHLRVVAAGCGALATRVDELLDAVGLAGRGDQSPRHYSTGMRQSLGLAAALVSDPAVLVLDEPASGLDPEAMLRLRAVLRAHAERGGTVLMTTHLFAEAELVADRVLVLERGRLIADDRVGDFVRAAGDPDVQVRTDHPQELARALTAAGASVTRDPAAPEQLRVHGKTCREVALVAGATGALVTELRVVERTLEQAFFAARRAPVPVQRERLTEGQPT